MVEDTEALLKFLIKCRSIHSTVSYWRQKRLLSPTKADKSHSVPLSLPPLYISYVIFSTSCWCSCQAFCCHGSAKRYFHWINISQIKALILPEILHNGLQSLCTINRTSWALSGFALQLWVIHHISLSDGVFSLVVRVMASTLISCNLLLALVR